MARIKTENTPDVEYIKPGETIELVTRFGRLSRGHAWGKCFKGKSRPKGDFEWVDKTGGTLYITDAGYYIVGSSDGFNRRARAEFELKELPEKTNEITIES